MCNDIVEVCFGNANGQIPSTFDSHSALYISVAEYYRSHFDFIYFTILNDASYDCLYILFHSNV